MQFLLAVIQPHAVTVFILALICFCGYGYPGYQARGDGGFMWLLWILGGVMATVSWFLLVIH